jgi:hypothetical protein
MPKKKKPLTKKTDEEILNELFPKKVIKKTKKDATKKIKSSILIKG